MPMVILPPGFGVWATAPSTSASSVSAVARASTGVFMALLSCRSIGNRVTGTAGPRTSVQADLQVLDPSSVGGDQILRARRAGGDQVHSRQQRHVVAGPGGRGRALVAPVGQHRRVLEQIDGV